MTIIFVLTKIANKIVYYQIFMYLKNLKSFISQISQIFYLIFQSVIKYFKQFNVDIYIYLKNITKTAFRQFKYDL